MFTAATKVVYMAMLYAYGTGSEYKQAKMKTKTYSKVK